jgi:hypothetical protein
MSGTTGQGWPFVTPDDHPKEYPTLSQALAEKLEADVIRAAAQARAAFTPVWSQDGGTVLSVGNGTLVGAVQRTGPRVRAHTILTRGSTTNMGTAQYLWSVPPPGPFTWTMLAGVGFYTHAGVQRPCFVVPVNASVVRLVRHDGVIVGHNTHPWAAGDSFVLNYDYLAV